MVTRRDYTAEGVEAARSVLVELVHLLGEYKGDIVLIGGWVPEVLMSEIEFAFSSLALVWSEDSSTSAEQDEDTTLILQLLLLNCEVVLEPKPSSYLLNLNSESICFIRFPKGE